MKPIPTKKWRKFLISQGLIIIGTKGSHEKWNYPPPKKLNRSIIVVTNKNDVPTLHLHTCLKTLNISKEEFMKMIEKI